MFRTWGHAHFSGSDSSVSSMCSLIDAATSAGLKSSLSSHLGGAVGGGPATSMHVDNYD